MSTHATKGGGGDLRLLWEDIEATTIKGLNEKTPGYLQQL